MRILFLGDVVGRPGRQAIKQRLSSLCQELQIDFVIANGENAAGGAGITHATANELLSAGVDVITTGDHVWDHKEAIELLQQNPRVLRPANYPPGVPGQGTIVLEKKGVYIGVINLQGRVFMRELENPFLCAERELEGIEDRKVIVIVDFHAEATSEKIAMGRMLDGRVAAVVGTHTHVQTADECILPKGTAYITDVGFTGPHASIIGREIDPIIRRFKTNMPQHFGVATGDVRLQGVIIDTDPSSRLAVAIKRLDLPVAECG